MKRSYLFLFLVLGVVAGIIASILTTIGIKERWLTAPLQREGSVLILAGPDLSDQVASNQVYTYYERGTWVALKWQGYQDGENRWKIPPELKVEKPNWEDNTSWSIDFWASFLPWVFYGAWTGTSAH